MQSKDTERKNEGSAPQCKKTRHPIRNDVNEGLNPRRLANSDFINAVQMQSLILTLIRWHFRICVMLSFTVYHPPYSECVPVTHSDLHSM